MKIFHLGTQRIIHFERDHLFENSFRLNIFPILTLVKIYYKIIQNSDRLKKLILLLLR